MSETPHLGPFAIEQKVGEGGMGVVYRARHETTDRNVAIKALLAETSGVEDVQRDFRREVQALAKLHHPSIAAVVDFGEIDASTAERTPDPLDEGTPWFAMEYVDGTPMNRVAGEWRWPELETMLRQTLDALAHAHARSVVHRDLKPANILVVDDGEGGALEVELVDFGLARRVDLETVLEAENRRRVTGTPRYMAPEQICRDWRDQGPWTDLYALGCLTWRLVCGEAPFDADTSEDLFEQHIRAPLPNFAPRFEVPPGLERWLRELLHKSVARRTRRAADAAYGLHQLGEPECVEGEGEDSARSSSEATVTKRQPTLADLERTVADRGSPTREAGEMATRRVEADVSAGEGRDGRDETGVEASVETRPPRELPDWRRDGGERTAAVTPKAGLRLFALREVPVVDRRAERDRVWRRLRDVREEGAPRLVTIEGGPGTGKSRLAKWVVRRAHEVGGSRPLRVTHEEAASSETGLREMVRRPFRTVGLSRAEVFERLVDRLPSLGADDEMRVVDARALTEFLRPTDDDAARVDGPRYRFAGPEQQKALLVRYLRRMAVRRPVLVWIDDLQWGEEAMDLVEAAFDAPGGSPPALFVATVRPGEIAGSDLESRLASVAGRDAGERLQLDPLGAEAHRELIGRLLDLAPDLADRLAERTEGNPLFAIQLVRDWVERDLLVPSDRGFELRDAVEVDVPESTHRLWLDRIEAWIDEAPVGDATTAWCALELASTFGRSVSEEAWEAGADAVGLESPRRLVDGLVDRGLAERTAEGWRFGHELLAESLRRRARDADRLSRHHRSCARVLEATAEEKILGPGEQIADHWIDGGEPERALAPLLEEIRRAARRSERETRVRLMERRDALVEALALDADDDRRLEQELEWARWGKQSGELERAGRMLAKVWRDAADEAPRLRGRAAQQLASVETEQGHPEKAREWAERALQTGRRVGAPKLEAEARQKLAWAAISMGEPDEAERHAGEAIELAQASGDRHGELDALWLKAFARGVRGGEEVGELYERIRREAAEEGYVVLEARALIGLGEEARFDGELDRAREAYERCLGKGQELSRPLLEAVVELNLAQVELRDGNPEAAGRHTDSAEGILETIGARESRTGLVTVLRLAEAAGKREGRAFDEHWAALEEGWPEAWRLIKDHPWVLEVAGTSAREAGWNERARRIWQLARGLWVELGDDSAARALEERIAEME